MSDSERRRRVTCQRRYLLNEFLLKFLREFSENSKNQGENGQKLARTFKNAENSLRKFPLEISEDSFDEQLKDVKFFGPFLVNKLKKKLIEFKNVNGELKFELLGDEKRRKTSKKLTKISQISPKSSQYTPKRGSGAYSILLALYDSVQNSSEYPKPDFSLFAVQEDELRRLAEKYSNEPMLKPSASRHYTAFSALTTLKTKNLVSTRISDGVKFVFLTQDGYDLARNLKNDEPTVEKPTSSSGFSYLTPGNCETLDKNEAERHLDDDLGGLEMYRIKTTVNYLETRMSTSLYKLDDQNGDYVTAYLNDFDSPQKAPGLETKKSLHDVMLLVDCSEILGNGSKNIKQSRQLLNDFLKTSNIKFEERKLNAGDYLWVVKNETDNQELVLDTVVERKRLDDLAKSIKDNRWYSQKYRLKLCGLKRVIFLFENMPNSAHIGLNPETLENAMINASVQDGFEVYRTRDVKDTARFLARVSKFLENFVSLHQDRITDENYITFDHFQNLASKTRKFDIETSLAAIFSQIPGVSVELAQNLSLKFGTLHNFLKTPNLEAKLRDTDQGGRCGRKVGQALAQKILYFMDVVDE